MKVLILGGGSAGWMTAAYMAKRGANLDITLLESSDVPIVGVGEATIPTIKRFNDRLGLTEKDWMPACNASYKFAIRFKDWHHKGADYWHPFESIPYFHPQHHLAHYWYGNQLEQENWMGRGDLDNSDFYSSLFVGVDMMKNNQILKNPEDPEKFIVYQVSGTETEKSVQSLPHAYHFDAGLYGEYLKTSVAIPNGVDHIVDHVEKVERAEDGNIAALHTRSGQRLEADLFVDCTGFASLLIEQELEVPFDSFSESLFCDRAVAMRLPFEDQKNEQYPYTVSGAMDAGWSWRIGLTNRIGTGYVYSSRHIDEQQAEVELRNYLGAERCENLDARHLKMRVGKSSQTWAKNCVAIGLSAGFVEPLESTGLELIQQGVERLTDALSRGDINAATRAAYNQCMTGLFEEVRDFIVLHYALSAREDTQFWRDVKNETVVSDKLGSLLADWKHFWPNQFEGKIFGETSWMCVLNGMGMFPTIDRYERMPPQELQQQLVHLQQMDNVRKGLGQIACDHYEYLLKMKS
ncbi:MAG: tryptophan halogenase family protein [Halioglobus sp.]